VADVFLTQGIIENALALYDKVVDVYYRFLINLRHRPDESISDYLSEAATGEAVEMLRSILETRKKHLGTNHIATGEAAYALGILKHVTGFDLDARNHYNQALAIYTKSVHIECSLCFSSLFALLCSLTFVHLFFLSLQSTWCHEREHRCDRACDRGPASDPPAVIAEAGGRR
jgi:hypothetical protein